MKQQVSNKNVGHNNKIGQLLQLALGSIGIFLIIGAMFQIYLNDTYHSEFDFSLGLSLLGLGYAVQNLFAYFYNRNTYKKITERKVELNLCKDSLGYNELKRDLLHSGVHRGFTFMLMLANGVTSYAYAMCAYCILVHIPRKTGINIELSIICIVIVCGLALTYSVVKRFLSSTQFLAMKYI